MSLIHLFRRSEFSCQKRIALPRDIRTIAGNAPYHGGWWMTGDKNRSEFWKDELWLEELRRGLSCQRCVKNGAVVGHDRSMNTMLPRADRRHMYVF